MEIRQAIPADLPAINQLMHGSSAYHGRYAAMLDGYNITKQHLQKDLFYIGIESNNIIGFYSLTIDPPELDHMFVSDIAQGKGVGRILFQHLIRQLEYLNIQTLKIVSHPTAVEFYKKMGAKLIGWQEAKGKVTWCRPILQLALH